VINRIKLLGFGIHKEFEATFKPGINAIIGKNRHGKTHIMEAICFGLFGKTQNSKLEKIVNFDSKEAIVILDTDEVKLTRKRDASKSTLERTTKLELETKLKVDYNEFLSIFYISSHEQKSLFDPAYLRKFLIGIFNLDRYSKRYDVLSAEYRGLLAVEQTTKKVNLPLLRARAERVKKIITAIKVKGATNDQASSKLDAINSVLSNKWGELRAHKSYVQRNVTLINQHKCNACGQKIHEDYKKALLAQVQERAKKLKDFEAILRTKQAEVEKKQAIVQKRINETNDRVFKGNQILTRISERARDTGNTVNVDRIKALEQVLPILNPRGFPAYLLQIYIPVITETTNNLLQIIFPDMRVSIRTEKPESNQPDFKPLIHKEDNIQEMSDLSGSERALVNLCFRLGTMVVYKQLCNTMIDFFMVDEGFEKVDDENSLRVMELFENFMEMGYLKQVFLVTHKDILKKQANINYLEL